MSVLAKGGFVAYRPCGLGDDGLGYVTLIVLSPERSETRCTVMAEQPEKNDSMPIQALGLRAHLSVLRKHWWFIALVMLCAVGPAFALTQRQERVYTTSAEVRLRSTDNAFLFPFPATGPRQLNRFGESEILFAQSPVFIEAAKLKSPAGVSVSVRASDTTLVFTARGTIPEDLAAAANSWAEAYVMERHQAARQENLEAIAFLRDTTAELVKERAVIRQEVVLYDELLAETTEPDQFSRILSQKVSIETLLQPQLVPLDSQIAQYGRDIADFELQSRFLDSPGVSALISGVARVPTSPVSPNVTRNLAVAVALGLVLGLGLPYLRMALNDKVDDPLVAAEISGLAILGTIPSYRQTRENSIEVLERPHSLASERYKAVLTAIEFASIGEEGASSLVFTSAVPGDGKTTTAVNVAALASKYMNVLLIDADMRRSRVHDLLGLSRDAGLSDILAGDIDHFDARQIYEHKGTKFDVITSGSHVGDPALLLRGQGWPLLLKELFLYDLIIIDAPPVLAVTDAVLIGKASSGQVLLTRTGGTKRHELNAAAELLASNGSPTFGVVVNHDNVGAQRYSYYGNYATERATT